MCVEVNGIRMRAFGVVKILPGLVFKKMDHEIRSYFKLIDFLESKVLYQ